MYTRVIILNRHRYLSGYLELSITRREAGTIVIQKYFFQRK